MLVNISNLVIQTDCKLIPKTITCDFEVALLNAVQEEFSRDDVDIACFSYCISLKTGFT